MTADALQTLRSLNLNLIPILYELLHCASVSETARRLHLTQSAVSGSLGQLRILFKDELLVHSAPQELAAVSTELAGLGVDNVLVEIDGQAGTVPGVGRRPTTLQNEAGLRSDCFGDNQRQPHNAEGIAQTHKDRRQRARQDHVPEQPALARTQATRGTDEYRVKTRDAVNGVQENREK